MTDRHAPAFDPKQRKPSVSKKLREDVADIVEPRTFETWVSPDKDRREDAATVYRKDKKGRLHQVPTVSPTERRRRRGGFQFVAELPSILDQLEQLRGGTAARVEMSSGRRAPASRPPAGADVADLIVDITVGSAALLREALISLGRASETTRKGRRGVRVQIQPDPTVTLQRLIDLVDDVTDSQLQDSIVRHVRSWKNAARLLLSHNAPMATLKFLCPMCRQQSLIVRGDASSDVTCSNDDCLDVNGNRTRWPRARWALLLESSG